jgi:SAM-dependent methyltransferase
VTDATSYDELPYEDYCFPRTHPEHLFAVSALYGRSAPRIEGARVLELGCARGGNLLPMALDLPGATFVGVDLSARQIDEAARRAAALGLRNVTFRHASITDLDATDGDFDYILCHGVYSWVPAPVREAILRVCHARLRPNGVAYVSFNALPGWHLLQTLRDFVLRHVPVEAPAPRRLALARQAFTVLGEAVRNERTPYAAWLRDELANLAAADDGYVFHEYLEADNVAVYLADFVAAAKQHRLAWLGDADLRLAGASLRLAGGDPVALAQSVDFAAGRRFRAALLVHEETAAAGVDVAAVARLHLASRAEPAAEAGVFTVDGRRVELRDPWLARALALLAERARRPVAYGALSGAVGAALGLDARASAVAGAAHAAAVVDLCLDGAIELRAAEARYAAEAGLRPVASPLARMQAAEGALVATLRHVRVELPDFERAVLLMLDGTRDRAALVAALGDAGRCEEALEWLAENALLMSEG